MTQLLDQLLINWFNNNPNITTLELKAQAIKNFPANYWTQTFVSDYLANQQVLDLDFSDNGTYRTYFVPQTMIVPDEQDIISAYQILVNSNKEVSKKNLKKELSNAGFDITNFKQLFENINFVHTGTYTKDQNKIYSYVPTGKHLSKTKGTVVDINSMNKKYLTNTIFKNYSDSTIEDLFGNGDSELYRLVKAYFTYDIRQVVN